MTTLLRNQLNLLVGECVSAILETMFFTAAEPCEAGEAGGPEWMQVAVDFEGAPSGITRLWLTEAAAVRMAGDFLGLDGSAGPDEARMTAFELANMICGSLVSRLESGSNFALAAPRSEPAAAPGEDAAWFWTDFGMIAVAFVPFGVDGEVAGNC